MPRITLVCFSIVLALTVTDVRAQQRGTAERLSEAKQLYDSAEYEQALTTMDAIDTASVTPQQARDRAVYRTLCLLALERSAQAESSIAEVIERDPLFQPTRDMPPRLRSLLTEVAAKLRPKLLQQHYRLGKQQFDAKEYNGAIKEFALVIDLIDAGGEGESQQEDIRTLAVGFRDLSLRALAAAAAAPATRSAPPAAAATPAAGPTPPAPAASTATVVPPTIIRQDVPPWPSSAAGIATPGARKGVLEIVVGPTGEVESAKMIKPIHPAYDAVLLAATKRWSYEPASQDGHAIEYVKRLEVTVQPK